MGISLVSFNIKPKYEETMNYKPSRTFLIPLALIATSLIQGKAQAQSACSSTYSPPATVEERRATGLLDDHVGNVHFWHIADSGIARPITLNFYDPDAPGKPSISYILESGELKALEGKYSSNWGIQMDDGPICILGKVSSWANDDALVSHDSFFALDTIRLLKASSESSASSPPALTLEQYFVRGNERYQKGDYQGAIEDYDANTRAGVKRDISSMPEMFYNSGNAYYKLGNYEKAAENYLKSIQVQGGFPEGYYNLAAAELALGKEEESASSYKNFLDSYSLLENNEEKYEESLRSGRPVLTDLEQSDLDGDILRIFTKIRWQSLGVPSISQSAISSALALCPRDIKISTRRTNLAGKLRKLGKEDMALQVQSGVCPPKVN